MTRSMTGYGRARKVVDSYEILVEVKSVNHRYFEFSSRVPRSYSYLEEKLKKLLSSDYISRGKVDVSVSIYSINGTDTKVNVNEGLVEEYVTALRNLKGKFKLKDDLSLSSISRFNDIFTVSKQVEDDSYIWSIVEPVATEAFKSFVDMREIEGEKLKDDILSRLDKIEEIVGKIEERSPETIEKYKERLYKKLKEVLEDKDIEEQRILTEAAIFADRIAVDEETVRLHSHIKQIRDMLNNSSEPIGRKLDFIIQELNREINTTGSKAQNIEIAHWVVDVKAEIEKIREQVQNIE